MHSLCALITLLQTCELTYIEHTIADL